MTVPNKPTTHKPPAVVHATTTGPPGAISPWERVWAATGALTVALFAAGLLFGDLLGSANYPPLDASTSQVRDYFLNNATEVRTMSFLHTLAALSLLAFSAYLHTVLSRDEHQRRGLPSLAFAGGAAAAVFLLLSALFYRLLSEPAVAQDPSLAHAMLVASYLAGGPAISVPLTLLIAAAIPTALDRLLLPRWIGWLGIVTVAASLASALTMLGPTDNHSAIYAILLLAAVLGFAWLVSTSVTLTTTRRR